jgi:hypothetical protein
MPSKPPLRVFVAYTGKDLEAHADAVAAVVRRLEWIAIDHKFWAPNGRPSVAECRSHIEDCHILIVLVAHRYGWVPTEEEGGDGKRSITRIEYEHGIARGLEIIPMLVEENAAWSPTMIEGLIEPRTLGPLNEFKRLLAKGLTGFFSTPQSVEALLPIPLQRAGERILAARVRSSSPEGIKAAGYEEAIFPYYSDPNFPPTVDERLTAPLPKRILSLEGAGVRSGITLGFLERIEHLLQIRYGSADVRLCDYFDLIGGAGPAAMIAAEIASGATMAEVKLAFRRGVTALTGAKNLLGILRGAVYSDIELRELLKERYGDSTLADATLCTGLCIIATRFDDGRTLSFANHPAMRDLPGSVAPLRDLILASAALPTYFYPVPVQLGEPRPTLLASGDVSAGPDPALHLFMLTTGRRGAFRWRTGKRRLFMLSLGGGTWRSGSSARDPRRPTTLELVPKIVNLMVEGLRQQSCSLLDSLTYEADATVAMSPEDPNAEPILSYRRFDLVLERQWLLENRLEEFAADVESLQTLDNVNAYDTYLRLGQTASTRQIQDVFLPYFDVRKPVARPGIREAQ